VFLSRTGRAHTQRYDNEQNRPDCICQINSNVNIGADFHRAMVATAPGEKLLIGRRPVRNWTQLQFFSLFHCELRLIVDVIDVMTCSLQSVNLLYLALVLVMDFN